MIILTLFVYVSFAVNVKLHTGALFHVFVFLYYYTLCDTLLKLARSHGLGDHSKAIPFSPIHSFSQYELLAIELLCLQLTPMYVHILNKRT